MNFFPDDSWLKVTGEELDDLMEKARNGALTNGFGLGDADDEEDSDDHGPAGSSASPMKQKRVMGQRQRTRARDMGQKVKDWVQKGQGPAAEGAEEPK